MVKCCRRGSVQMKKQFSNRLMGYNKEQVTRCIQDLKKDYEDELGKKRERMMELSEENRRLKLENEEQSERLARYIEQEKYISRALIKAEQRGEVIIEDSQQRSKEEMIRVRIEKSKWQEKFREVRNEILNFEQIIVNIMEKFRDEINYYTAKEISESILLDEEDAQEETKKVIA